MKKFTFLLIFAAALGHAQTTTITASNIDYFGGAPVTGKFCLSPTDSYGNPINLTTTTGQQFPANPPLCFTVTAGALQSGANIPDVSTTQPRNACYRVQILNATGSVVGKTPCIQPTGTTWSFDSYIPSNQPNIPYYQPILGGVTGINNTLGALTFIGSGFSQSGNVFTFNGGGASTPATSSLLKGNGSANGVVAASAGTDYAVPVSATAAGQVPVASGAGTAYTAGFIPWGAFAGQLSNLSITQGSYTDTFNNTFNFTLGQNNQNWILNGNSVNMASEFQGFQSVYQAGSFYFNDELDLGLGIPSSSTAFESNTLGIFSVCGSATTDCVPIYTQAHRTIAGAPIWGANFNAWDGGLGGGNMFGVEIDSIASNATTTGEALRIFSRVVAGATYNGIHFLPSSGVLTNGILLDNGSATTGINIGENAAGTNSMPISMTSSIGMATFNYTANGFFNFSASILTPQIDVLNGLSTGQCMYNTFGTTNTAANAVDFVFCNAGGTGSAANYGGIDLAGQINNTANFFQNLGSAFGATTVTTPPANGIAVGTAGQFQVNGNGQESGPVFVGTNAATITAAAGAGTSPTVKCYTADGGQCTGTSGLISVLTGTSPTAGELAVGTWAATPEAARCTVSGNGPTSALLVPFQEGETTTAVQLWVANAPAALTQYYFTYVCGN